jgi:uncharacterized protein YdaU (DUF1376 family)
MPVVKYPAFLFYPEDFMAGTAHMSPLAVGVYIRCLCYQWSHGSIPSNSKELSRLCGATPDELTEAWPSVTDKFQDAGEGRLQNKRLVETLADLRGKRRRRSTAGKRGAESRWGDGNANGKRMAKTKQHDDKHMASRVVDVNEDEFELFWKVFPSGRKKSKGRARTAFLKAAAKIPAATIIDAATEYAASDEGCGRFVKMPETWLNGECWTDDRDAWQDHEQTTKQKVAPI